MSREERILVDSQCLAAVCQVRTENQPLFLAAWRLLPTPTQAIVMDRWGVQPCLEHIQVRTEESSWRGNGKAEKDQAGITRSSVPFHRAGTAGWIPKRILPDVGTKLDFISQCACGQGGHETSLFPWQCQLFPSLALKASSSSSTHLPFSVARSSYR